MSRAMSSEQLRRLGEACFGHHWQTPMARVLAVETRMVRRWLAGELEIPANHAETVRQTLAARQAFNPIVLFEDRYGGMYSGGPWLALANGRNVTHPHRILDSRIAYCLRAGPSGDDAEAGAFWASPPEWIAAGASPVDARDRLTVKLLVPASATNNPPHEPENQP